VTNTARLILYKRYKTRFRVSIINDRIGPSDENNLAVDFPIISISEDFKPLD
jgi:hypothetical protein